MANKLEYTVLPKELQSPPNFVADVSPWGVGGTLMFVGFFLAGWIGSAIDPKGGGPFAILFFIFEAAAIVATIVIYNERKKSQINEQTIKWTRWQVSEHEEEARALTQRAHQAVNSFNASLRRLPGLLRDAEIFLSNSEEEFRERAYAPFWDNIEQAALNLGAFNSNLTRLENDGNTYKDILSGRTHNFPPLLVQPDEIPNPAQQAGRLRQLVRMGQKDFEFATIWEHRKTQNVILEGFRTLGEAVNNLGLTIDGSFTRVTKSIEERSGEQLREQVRLRETFEHAVHNWEERKRLSGV